MMTPTTVTQEIGRLQTRDRISRADAYRASRTEADSPSRRRGAWTAIAGVFRGRATTPGITPEPRPRAATAI